MWEKKIKNLDRILSQSAFALWWIMKRNKENTKRHKREKADENLRWQFSWWPMYWQQERLYDRRKNGKNENRWYHHWTSIISFPAFPSFFDAFYDDISDKKEKEGKDLDGPCFNTWTLWCWLLLLPTMLCFSFLPLVWGNRVCRSFNMMARATFSQWAREQPPVQCQSSFNAERQRGLLFRLDPRFFFFFSSR